MRFTSSLPCALYLWTEGGFPLKSSVKVLEDNNLLPQQRKASESLVNPVMSPPRYKMQMAVQEFHKLDEPKISKLKGGFDVDFSFCWLNLVVSW